MTDLHPASNETHAGAQHFCRTVGRLSSPDGTQRVLVAGCGEGHEALFIRKELGGTLVGVDIGEEWDPELGSDIEGFDLRAASILDLPFPDNSFDLVFYHHVIEHASAPVARLPALARVLAPGGIIYPGTPNRHRALGYIGSFDATIGEKVRWNLADYRARLTGRFHNDKGAHAGFSERELRDLLTPEFAGVESLTGEYLRFKYGARVPGPLLRTVCAPGLRDVAAPSVYAVAHRPPVAADTHAR